MRLTAWTEIQLAVGGTLRLAIGDRRGLGFFDVSLDGFWRSFRAAVLCYPLFLLLLAVGIPAARWQAAGAATIIIVRTIGYVISWSAFPLLILPLTRFYGREHRFLLFMIVYNWSQIPQTVLVALIALDEVSGLMSAGAAQLAGLLTTVAVLVYEGYIARVTLAITIGQALLIVILDLVLGTAVSRVANALL